MTFRLCFCIFTLITCRCFGNVYFRTCRALTTVRRCVITASAYDRLLFGFVEAIHASLFDFGMIISMYNRYVKYSYDFRHFDQEGNVIPSILSFGNRSSIFRYVMVSILGLSCLNFSVRFIMTIYCANNDLFNGFRSE